jgi:hypothetical protein
VRQGGVADVAVDGVDGRLDAQLGGYNGGGGSDDGLVKLGLLKA